MGCFHLKLVLQFVHLPLVGRQNFEHQNKSHLMSHIIVGVDFRVDFLANLGIKSLNTYSKPLKTVLLDHAHQAAWTDVVHSYVQ